jgi:hypothetical protein
MCPKAQLDEPGIVGWLPLVAKDHFCQRVTHSLVLFGTGPLDELAAVWREAVLGGEEHPGLADVGIAVCEALADESWRAFPPVTVLPHDDRQQQHEADGNRDRDDVIDVHQASSSS